eukprot:315591-Chlamydomonas_euryale.AAC.2
MHAPACPCMLSSQGSRDHQYPRHHRAQQNSHFYCGPGCESRTPAQHACARPHFFKRVVHNAGMPCPQPPPATHRAFLPPPRLTTSRRERRDCWVPTAQSTRSGGSSSSSRRARWSASLTSCSLGSCATTSSTGSTGWCTAGARTETQSLQTRWGSARRCSACRSWCEGRRGCKWRGEKG